MELLCTAVQAWFWGVWFKFVELLMFFGVVG